MALYALICLDKPGMLELRTQLRPQHVEYLKSQEAVLRMCGPLLDPQGDMNGSLIVIEVDDEAAAKAFSAGDPFFKNGIFGSVDIRLFKRTMGSWSA
jgi:uncharacterized protein YciI